MSHQASPAFVKVGRPHFVVGTDAEGHWIARDRAGLVGGIFVSRRPSTSPSSKPTMIPMRSRCFPRRSTSRSRGALPADTARSREERTGTSWCREGFRFQLSPVGFCRPADDEEPGSPLRRHGPSSPTPSWRPLDPPNLYNNFIPAPFQVSRTFIRLLASVPGLACRIPCGGPFVRSLFPWTS